jgi:DNA-binding NarL/FixJ family response regulator
MWGQAQALRETAGTPRWASEQEIVQRWMEQVRVPLGKARFQASWAQGYRMGQEQTAGPEAVETIKASRLSRTTTLSLTPRERDVLRLLADGLSNKEIAERLVLSVVTVNSYLRTIYSKLGVSSRTAAVRFALDHHLVERG